MKLSSLLQTTITHTRDMESGNCEKETFLMVNCIKLLLDSSKYAMNCNKTKEIGLWNFSSLWRYMWFL